MRVSAWPDENSCGMSWNRPDKHALSTSQSGDRAGAGLDWIFNQSDGRLIDSLKDAIETAESGE